MAESDRGPVTAALVSTDGRLRETLRSVLPESGVDVRLDVVLDVPYPDIADPHLEELRRASPAIVFLDLDGEPDLGFRFAQFLIDASLGRAIIGVASDLSPDLLLSAMQAGVVEFLPKPVNATTVRDAIQRVWRKTGRKVVEEEKTPGKLLSIFSPKGGAGATTLSVNLAVEIHRLSRARTLLVDLDLELGDTALMLDIEPRFSMVDLLRNFHRVDSGLLASYIERHESGVELLSAPSEPADFEAASGERVGQVLDFLREHYDYVIADTPKTFNATTLAAFEDADEVFMVSVADLPSLRNISRCLPLFRRISNKDLDEWLRLVINRYDSRQLISVDEVEETLGLEAYWTLRNDYDEIMEAINEGRPVVSENGSSYAEDVRGLASRITGVTTTRRRGRGWFRRLLERLGIRPGTRASHTSQLVTANE